MLMNVSCLHHVSTTVYVIMAPVHTRVNVRLAGQEETVKLVSYSLLLLIRTQFPQFIRKIFTTFVRIFQTLYRILNLTELYPVIFNASLFYV